MQRPFCIGVFARLVRKVALIENLEKMRIEKGKRIKIKSQASWWYACEVAGIGRMAPFGEPPHYILVIRVYSFSYNFEDSSRLHTHYRGHLCLAFVEVVHKTHICKVSNHIVIFDDKFRESGIIRVDTSPFLVLFLLDTEETHGFSQFC